jgi:hypothetical protein
MRPNPQPTIEQRRAQLVASIASITTMQPGTLTEEYRAGAAGEDGKPSRLGPYYKFQVWRDGANRTSRVPASKAAGLREDTANWRNFHDLCAQLARLNTEHTLALRAAEASAADTAGAKKNSTRKRAANGSPKRKLSSRKPRRS